MAVRREKGYYASLNSVSSVDMSGRPRCIKTKLYYKRNFIGDNSDIKVISQKKRLPMNAF